VSKNCHHPGEMNFILFSLSHAGGPYRAVVSGLWRGVGGGGGVGCLEGQATRKTPKGMKRGGKFRVP